MNSNENEKEKTSTNKEKKGVSALTTNYKRDRKTNKHESVWPKLKIRFFYLVKAKRITAIWIGLLFFKSLTCVMQKS